MALTEPSVTSSAYSYFYGMEIGVYQMTSLGLSCLQMSVMIQVIKVRVLFLLSFYDSPQEFHNYTKVALNVIL